MASRGNVRISLTADADGVTRGTRQAERDIDRLNTRGSASFKGLGVAAKGSAVAIGAASVVAIKFGADVVKAAADAEAAQARLQTALKNSGISWKENAKAIDAALQKQSELSAFDDEDLSDSLAKLVTHTKDVNEALRLNALAADLARGRQISLEAATKVVEKAYDGNAGALGRYGIKLKPVTDAVEALKAKHKDYSQQALEAAQRTDLIATRQANLAALQQRFGGQAKAFGDTSAGSIARIGVAWENIQESLGKRVGPTLTRVLNAITQVLNQQGPAWDKVRAAGQRVVDWYNQNLKPTVESVTKAVQAIWARFGDSIEKIAKSQFGQALRDVTDSLKNIRDVIQGVMALINGDWGRAWDKLSAVPVRLLRGAIARIRALAGQFATAARAIAGALADGFKRVGSDIINAIVDGIRSIGSRIKQAILDYVPSISDITDALGISGGRNPAGTSPIVTRSRAAAPGQPGGAHRAAGGFLPGRYRGRDTMTIRAAPGEAILTPAQQRIVGISRIVDAYRRTGGIMGDAGDGFARGGVIDRAIAFGRAQLNDPYVFGAGHGGGDSSAWDCSGLASAVANQIPGYSGGFGDTDSLYASSSAAKGNEAVLFGFAHPGATQNGVKKQWGHVFIKVGDQVFNAHSPGLGIDQNASPGAVYRVPAGLENITGDAGDGIRGGTRSSGPDLTTVSGLSKFLGGAGVKGKGVARSISQRILQAGSDVTSVAGDLVGRPESERAASAAGRAARAGARSGGRSEEDVSAAGEEAERKAQIANVKKDIRTIDAFIRQEIDRMKKLLGDLKRIPKKASAKGKRARALINRALRQTRNQLRALRETRAGLADQLADLGEQAAAAEYAKAQEDIAAHDEAVGLRAAGGPETLTPGAQASADITALGRDDSLQGKQAQGAGEERARQEGVTNPEQISNYGQRAVLDTRRQDISKAAGIVSKALDDVRERIRRAEQNKANVFISLQHLNKRAADYTSRRRSLLDRIATLNDLLGELRGEESGLIDQAADLAAQGADLDFDLASLNQQIANTPSAAPTGTDTATSANADQAAQLAQAEQRAAVATRGLGLAEDFIRTALGPTDISGPGISITINSLHPADPQTLAAVGGATVAALSSLGSVLSSTVTTGV